jgi:hypothetical protein
MPNPADDITEIDSTPESPQTEVRMEDFERLLRLIESRVPIPARIVRITNGVPIADLYEMDFEDASGSPMQPTRVEIPVHGITSIRGQASPFIVGAELMVNMTSFGIAIPAMRELPLGSGRNKVLSIVTNGLPGLPDWDYVKFNRGQAPVDNP